MAGSSFISNSNKMLKKITGNIGLVLIVVFIFDLAIGKTLRHFYFTETSGLHYRTTYSIDSTKADILVFGSSRANHHYVPEVFEDSLKMSFYNTGRDGNTILYNLAVFKSIIKRYTPKIIIFDLMASELNYNIQSYDRLSSLQPYYFQHSEIQDIVKLRGPFESFKLGSSIYPFNSSITTIIVGNLGFNKKRKGDNKGYIPLFGSIMDTNLTRSENYIINYDTTKIQALNYITKTCKSKNIKLVFIQSPFYARGKTNASTQLIAEIANNNGSIFFNYLNDPIFIKHPGYFKDINHLNNDGAIYFSTIIAHSLLERINVK